MNQDTSMRRAGTMLAGLSLLAVLAFAGEARAASRDILWDAVTSCLDTTAIDYCEVCNVPRTDKPCGKTACEDTLEVWAESNYYIALRDRKMCGCPDDFVHGLAIPRAQVTGVEDPRRPSGIWSFAWEVGLKRIGDPSALALAANPVSFRSQDQLHVHMVRLKRDAWGKLRTLPNARVNSLDAVWAAARDKANAAQLDEYGVLVTAHPEGGFLVVVDPENPEHHFTQSRCR